MQQKLVKTILKKVSDGDAAMFTQNPKLEGYKNEQVKTAIKQMKEAGWLQAYISETYDGLSVEIQDITGEGRQKLREMMHPVKKILTSGVNTAFLSAVRTAIQWLMDIIR